MAIRIRWNWCGKHEWDEIEKRAAAIEALDKIGNQKLARSIVSLLEEEPEPADASDMIAVLLKSTDLWLRTLAAGSTSELGLREFLPLLHHIGLFPTSYVGKNTT